MFSFKQFIKEQNSKEGLLYFRSYEPTDSWSWQIDVGSCFLKAGRNPYYVYLSHSQDPKKNPLTYKQKVTHVRKMFPQHSRNVILDTKVKNVMDIASFLHTKGFEKITMVVGADRITEFKTLLSKYNGVKGPPRIL